MRDYMWIRLFRAREDKEILVNVNTIWKIEVSYVIPGPNQRGFEVSLEKGLSDPEAIRVYKIFFGSETANLSADSDSPAIKAIQEIYDNSLKGK